MRGRLTLLRCEVLTLIAHITYVGRWSSHSYPLVTSEYNISTSRYLGHKMRNEEQADIVEMCEVLTLVAHTAQVGR